MRQRWQTLQEHFIQVGDLFSPGTKGLLELKLEYYIYLDVCAVTSRVWFRVW